MATTDIERLDDAIQAVEVKIEMIEKQLLKEGLSDEMQIALRKNIDTYGADKASLKAEKRELQGSAPSGNPINLSQSLHKVFECVVVVSFPLVLSPPVLHLTFYRFL
jgi:hypothetical protein